MYADRIASVKRGMTLLEALAAITIVAVLAVVVVPRIGSQGGAAKGAACRTNVENINVQTSLWFRNHETLPLTDLSDIGPDVNYFPDGLPMCPVDGSAYQIDNVNGEVIGHTH